MEIGSEDSFERCIRAIMGNETPRVWSLIISLFGDMSQSGKSEIGAAVVGSLIEPLGVTPSALRVALHRLKKDGWIESRMSGRMSFYSLTGYGKKLVADASPQIYATHPDWPETWHLLIYDDREKGGPPTFPNTDDYVALGARSLLGAGPLPADCGAFLGAEIADLRVPDWIKRKICPSELEQAYADFETALNTVETELSAGSNMTAQQVLTLRTLLVHSWRRLVLRHADLPPKFFPKKWAGSSCRQSMSRVLEMLSAKIWLQVT